jgi:hypothetical protein
MRINNVLSPITLLMISFLIVGCEQKNDEALTILQNLKSRYEKEQVVNTQLVNRIDKDVAEYLNKKEDFIPILIYAELVNAKNSEEVYLRLAFYDEDTDLLGFGIRQKADNQYGFTEVRYPIYIKRSLKKVSASLLPINISTNIKDKNETLWSLYVRSDKASEPGFLDIPPVWISLPDDPEIMLEVFLYDKEGNISEFVKIENKLDRHK